MKLFRQLVSNTIFFLNILLLFLFAFREQLVVPAGIQPIGRMHPMLLHLPIGILLLALMMVFFSSGFKKKSFQNFLNFTLYLAALTAALTAVMGLLLSAEGGYAAIPLNRHIISGVLVSLLTWFLLLVSLYAPEKKLLFQTSLGATIAVMMLAGHFGSVLTHGEDFVWKPLHQEEEMPIVINDSTSLYTAAVYPVLKAKCTSCHNAKKAKGNLIMTSAASILAGGEHGPIWIAGDPQNSKMVTRIHLPAEDEDHMPPNGKPQLSPQEQYLLYQWILNGADLLKPWTKYNKQDSLRLAAEPFIHQEARQEIIHYPFAFADPAVIEELNTPTCVLTQLALDEPALEAEFFVASGYDTKNLERLLKVKEQLVSLNLSSVPVKEDDGKIIQQFNNLERLNLNRTPVSPGLLKSFQTLKKLTSLSLAGTTLDQQAISVLTKLKLKEVFLWNTLLTANDIALLQKQFPATNWDAGYHSSEILTLTPPMLVNENTMIGENEKIVLKHNLPGTLIRFTTDGREPDSINSPVYKTPLAINGYTTLKTRAFRPGWYGSQKAEFILFKKGISPLTQYLLWQPNKDYKGQGALTLTDSKKGNADAFRDIAWLGFREHPLVALFKFDKPVSSVTLSYGKVSASYILPPLSVEVWAGEDSTHLTIIKRIVPAQPAKKEPGKVEGIVIDGLNTKSTYYKLVATPIPQVPVWISKKPEKGWLFVDEIIFN